MEDALLNAAADRPPNTVSLGDFPSQTPKSVFRALIIRHDAAMFSPLMIAGFSLLVIGLFSSRLMIERAFRLLSSEEKLKLLDAFTTLRMFGALPFAFLALCFFAIPYFPQSTFWFAYLCACALFAAYLVTTHYIVRRKMRALGINAAYRKAYRNACWLTYGGFVAFFILVTLGPFL